MQKNRIKKTDSMFRFMESLAGELRVLGRYRTSETYTSALNSFRKFRDGRDVPIGELDAAMMMSYEAYLKSRGLLANTTSFYMRILRAAYNRASELGLVSPGNPFRYVYTGVGRTVKRAVSLAEISRIREMPLPYRSTLDFARDRFLFSFYTRGMPFVDMAYLRKKDLACGMLAYRRRKTGQLLQVRWESCMQDIVEKYQGGCASGIYLLPIIADAADERMRYLRMSHKVNRNLKTVGRMASLEQPLTMYVARHSWASAARNKHIPLSVISDGMGHESEHTTRIYLDSIDNSEIDMANKLILNSL